MGIDPTVSSDSPHYVCLIDVFFFIRSSMHSKCVKPERNLKIEGKKNRFIFCAIWQNSSNPLHPNFCEFIGKYFVFVTIVEKIGEEDEQKSTHNTFLISDQMKRANQFKDFQVIKS